MTNNFRLLTKTIENSLSTVMVLIINNHKIGRLKRTRENSLSTVMVLSINNHKIWRQFNHICDKQFEMFVDIH